MSLPRPQRVRSTSPLSPSPLPRPPWSQQHNPYPTASLTPPPKTLLYLSSSPASSPLIVESPPTRTRSVRLEMNNFMDQGVAPGADFFDPDSSGDEGAWVDDNGTRDFSKLDGLGLGIRESTVSTDFESEDADYDEKGFSDAREYRGWQRGRARARTSYNRNDAGQGTMRARSPFNQVPAYDFEAGTMMASPHDAKENGRARQMRLPRVGQFKGVQLPGSRYSRQVTCRESIASNKLDSTTLLGELQGPDGSNDAVEKRHRRSTSDSIICTDSVINAHVITMRALESLSPSSSFSLAHAHTKALAVRKNRQHSHSVPASTFQKSFGTSSLPSQKIKISPMSNADLNDPYRPEHLPSHFVKTPYPFTSKKEFPKPRTRPRVHDFDRGHNMFYEHENVSIDGRAKGKRALGIPTSGGAYDIRPRSQRNEAMQGGTRSMNAALPGTKGYRGLGGGRINARDDEKDASKECMIFVSLRARRGHGGVVDRLERVGIPANLTTTSPRPEPRGHKLSPRIKTRHEGEKLEAVRGRDGTITIDFDDAFFAAQLRHAYRSLAGNWFWRTFSARTLKCIQLGQVSMWSGSDTDTALTTATKGLLAARGGLLIRASDGSESTSPFTADNLIDLYRCPKKGKARYTWVHWARRASAINSVLEVDDAAPKLWGTMRSTFTNPGIEANDEDTDEGNSEDSQSKTRTATLHPSDVLTTLEFTHSFSPLRILIALAIIFTLSVLAALLWIFLGISARNLAEVRGRAERVGSGMAVGGLAFALQMVGFAIWVGGCWMWV